MSNTDPTVWSLNPTTSAIITFNSTQPDANGCDWYVDTVPAGWVSPKPKVSVLSKVGADGQILSENYWGPRAITFAGSVWCPDVPGMWAARKALRAAADTMAGYATLSCYQPDATVYCNVRLDGEVQMKDASNGLTLITFQVPLTADDPRKFLYGTTTVYEA